MVMIFEAEEKKKKWDHVMPEDMRQGMLAAIVNSQAFFAKTLLPPSPPPAPSVPLEKHTPAPSTASTAMTTNSHAFPAP